MAIHVAAHWLALIAFTALAGGVIVPLIVMQSASARPLVEAVAAAQRRWLAGWLMAGAVASALAWLTAPAVFEDARAGWLLAARVALLGAMALAVWQRHETGAWIVAPALGLLLTQSLLSRSAALPDWIPHTLNDWFHMTLTALWLGGVALLAFVVIPAVAQRPALLGAFSHVVDRFSPLAMFCVLGLGISGVIQAGAFVRDLSGLIETDYGRALSAKLVVAVALVGFGALHQQVIAPRLRLWQFKAGQLQAERATLRFRISLYAEVAASMILLLFVAMMKSRQ